MISRNASLPGQRRHRTLLIFSVLVFVLAGIVVANRVTLHSWWVERSAPTLPVATHRVPRATDTGLTDVQEASPVEGGIATSTHFSLVTAPIKLPVKKNIDPLVNSEAMPSEINLDVPFLSQAPTGDWSYPYQEACEEASSLMVDAYYADKKSIDPIAGKQAIDSLVKYEMDTFGYYKDTPTSDVTKFLKGYFGYTDVRVLPFNVSNIKRAVANGYPVMIPANGKLLPNPNFKNGGPLYHMLVVKGYTADRFITNDPGTRNGKNFTYTFAALQKAAHDWNATANVADGPAVMLIIIDSKR